MRHSRHTPPTESESDQPESGYAKSRDTRDRILNAALEEAGESGFHKTSVAAIAARAGVAIGSLHYHFGSRAELLQELMRQLMDDYMARAQAAEAQRGGDYFSRERALLLSYAAHLRRHPSYVRLADEIKLHEPELYRLGALHWVERMAERIRSGIAEGTLHPLDEPEIKLMAHFLVGARHALEALAQSDERLDEEAVVDAYLEFVRNGLGVRRHSGALDSPRSRASVHPNGLSSEDPVRDAG
ncbi:MAG: TetR/AcrR family transcriptional regulator [bacterium]